MIAGNLVGWERLIVVTLNVVVENASGGSEYSQLHALPRIPLKFTQFVGLDIGASHLPARGAELATRNSPELDGPLEGILPSPASRSLCNSDFSSFSSSSPSAIPAHPLALVPARNLNLPLHVLAVTSWAGGYRMSGRNRGRGLGLRPWG